MRIVLAVFAIYCFDSSLHARAGGLAGAVDVGDTREQVLHALGDPQGTVQLGDTEVLFFPRGQVDIKDEKVVNHTILSMKVFEERERRRREAEEEARKREAETKTKAGPGDPSAPDKAASSQTDEKAAEAARARELEERIAQGIDEPPFKMSSRKLRRYLRGRSPSQIEQRKQQITRAFESEQEETP